MVLNCSLMLLTTFTEELPYRDEQRTSLSDWNFVHFRTEFPQRDSFSKQFCINDSNVEIGSAFTAAEDAAAASSSAVKQVDRTLLLDLASRAAEQEVVDNAIADTTYALTRNFDLPVFVMSNSSKQISRHQRQKLNMPNTQHKVLIGC